MVRLFTQVEEAHGRPLVDAVVFALQVVVEEEAPKFELILPRGVRGKGLAADRIGTRVVPAPVGGSQDQHLLGIAEVPEAEQRPVGGARVHPADQNEHGNARGLDLVLPVDRADLGPGLAATHHVVAVFGFHHSLEDVRVGGVLGHGPARPEGSVLVFIDAPHPGTHHVHVIVVHVADQVAPGLDESAGQQAVGAHRTRVGVEVRPPRDDRLDGRVIHGSEQLGRRARVRGPVGADRPIRPLPGHHPFHDVVRVENLLAAVLHGRVPKEAPLPRASTLTRA